MRRGAPGRSPRRPARCRSARGSRRTADASGGSRVRPRRRGAPGRRGALLHRGAAGPRSARRCTSAGGDRTEGARAARARRRPRGRRTCRRPCSPGRARRAVGSPAGAAQSLAGAPIERRQRSAVARGHPEPHGADRAGRRREAVDVLCDAAVLRDRRAREDAREDSGRRGDAERGDERAAVSSANPAEGEPEHVPGASHQGTAPCRPTAVRPRLLAPAADLHRAPARRSVPRPVVEEPAARLLAAGLHPRPVAAEPGLDDDRDERPEPPGRPLSRKQPAAVDEPRAERGSASVASTTARRAGGERDAERVRERGASRSVERSACASARVSSSTVARTSSSPRSESHPSSAAGVAMSSRSQSGTSVLTKSWTRSSGAGAGGLPPGWKPSGTVRR